MTKMTTNDNNNNGDGNTRETDGTNESFNPIDSYSRAMKRLDELLRNGSEDMKAKYQAAMIQTIEAYYSFMDAQVAMDTLAKMRAEAITAWESNMKSMGVEFEAEFTQDDNVIKPTVFNKEKDNDDPGKPH